VGRQTKPPHGQRRLGDRPLSTSRDGHPIRPPHDRLLRVGAQHATPPLQRKLARPVERGGRLPTPHRHPMARRKQHLQPPLATTNRPRPKTTTKRPSSHSGPPPVGNKKRGIKHLPSWRATRRSCRPVLTCSVPGGGTNAVQSASLSGPSPYYSGFPSGLVVPPPERRECYADHVQHTTGRQPKATLHTQLIRYATKSKWRAAIALGPTRYASTCSDYWELRTALAQKRSNY
jgi:hypothetical protein